MLAGIRHHIRSLGDAERSVYCQRYFKTGPGEYAEGDRFIGLDAKTMHGLAKRYTDTPLDVVEQLLQSPFHEERSVALLILVRQFARGNHDAILALYLRNTHRINNWDLVDCSAPQIVGAGGDLALLRRLAKSSLLWERRIAIVGTQHLIRGGNFEPTLIIARLLLHDDHDLIHKAVGWMLREVGKCDVAVEKQFLDEHAAVMPRTMLRYAIERFPEGEKKRYMAITPSRASRKSSTPTS
jgi:3-methyladenine DNA glycosylase AlkD